MTVIIAAVINNREGTVEIDVPECYNSTRTVDWLKTYTRTIQGSDSKLVRIGLTLEKAQDLIELLQEYVEYRTTHPKEGKE